MPFLVKACHSQNWSVEAWAESWVTTASVLGSAAVPVKLAPASLETLIRMSLLQEPATLTPV